jgi:hypothetical protein
MATTYTATVTLHCWKQHTCVGCGSNYRYQFKRKKSGQGGTQAKAHAAVEKAVVNALANEVDMQPCPGCGLYQPDMIGARRSKQHWWLVAIAAVILLILIILAASSAVQYPTVTRIATAVCGVLLVCHFIVERGDPNRSQGANQRKAQLMAERGQIELCVTGSKDPTAVEKPRPANSAAGLLLCGIYALGIVAMGAAEMMRTASGWPYNNECYPGVAGAGDSTRIYFVDYVRSVKGYWTGQAKVEVLNAQELGLANPQLAARSKNDSWGSSISVKSSEKNSSSQVWADVQFPKSANLADKEIQLKITVNATFPTIRGGANNFDNAQDTFTRTAAVKLAGPEAGSKYVSTYWLGMLGGTAIVIVVGILLARSANSMRRQALPTSVTPVGAPTRPPVEDSPTWAQEQGSPEQIRPDNKTI